MAEIDAIQMTVYYSNPVVLPLTLHSYQFNDELKESGSYSYRLKLTTATGKVTFSPVRTVSFKNNSSISIYPIPAQSWLNISSNKRIRVISVTNLWQQKVDVTVKQQTDYSIQLNIDRLPANTFQHFSNQVMVIAGVNAQHASLFA